MSKKALVISIDDKVCKLICRVLEENQNNLENVEDIIEGFKGLKKRDYDSIIVNMKEGKELINETHNIIKCKDICINVAKRTVSYNGNPIQLTPKEFDILYFLAENKGKIYSKNQIYSNVWKEAYSFDDSNIMAHIRKIRKKIEPNPAIPIFIQTVWGVGYKFNSELS